MRRPRGGESRSQFGSRPATKLARGRQDRRENALYSVAGYESWKIPSRQTKCIVANTTRFQPTKNTFVKETG